MRLHFRLLVVDDNARGIGSALASLRDYLKRMGYELVRDVRTSLDTEEVGELRKEGRKYDLVMVDYNLGPGKRRGGVGVVARLRAIMRYTETVFYSVSPQKDLYEEIAGRNIQGVFVAEREELPEVLRGLADIVIGKSVDLTHTRGLAMAEGADMERLMLRTIGSVLEGKVGECVEKATERSAQRLRKAKKSAVKRLKKKLREKSLSGVLDDRLFDAHHRWMTILALAKCLPEGPDGHLDTVKRYDTLAKRRNRLAHDAEEATEQEVVALLMGGAARDTVKSSDDAMAEFRRDLRRHRDALEAVCRAIDREFGGTGKEKKSQT